jgi:hypothetical protein
MRSVVTRRGIKQNLNYEIIELSCSAHVPVLLYSSLLCYSIVVVVNSVAYATKSDVEDGYRWRKYGQKAVKNSTYPRYVPYVSVVPRRTTHVCMLRHTRCPSTLRNTQIRMQELLPVHGGAGSRSAQQDPSTVITTYEGQHTHPSPVVGLRLGGGGGALIPPAARRCSALAATAAPFCRSFPEPWWVAVASCRHRRCSSRCGGGLFFSKSRSIITASSFAATGCARVWRRAGLRSFHSAIDEQHMHYCWNQISECLLTKTKSYVRAGRR